MKTTKPMTRRHNEARKNRGGTVRDWRSYPVDNPTLTSQNIHLVENEEQTVNNHNPLVSFLINAWDIVLGLWAVLTVASREQQEIENDTDRLQPLSDQQVA